MEGKEGCIFKGGDKSGTEQREARGYGRSALKWNGKRGNGKGK